MHVNGKRIHMGQTGGDIGDLAGLIGRILADVGVLGKRPAFNQPVLSVPAGLAREGLL